jgi:hypothetical protein
VFQLQSVVGRKELTVLAVVALVKGGSAQLLRLARDVVMRNVAVGFLRGSPRYGHLFGPRCHNLDITRHAGCCNTHKYRDEPVNNGSSITPPPHFAQSRLTGGFGSEVDNGTDATSACR